MQYLEKYILERGYSEKMVRKEILRARAIPRNALLEKVNNQEKQNKITFNIKYHPVFRDVRKILEELHFILASDDGHKKVFPDVPIIGFKIKKKQLKGTLGNITITRLACGRLVQAVWRKNTSWSFM